MQPSSSDSESDCIDDTGCEEHFEPTYWDINYFHQIELDNGDENENEDDENENITKVKEIQRYKHIEETENGEQHILDYPIYNDDSDDDSDEESEDDYSDESYFNFTIFIL